MTHEFGKVGILYGGHSAERTVSLQSGEGVLSALQSKGIDAHLFDTGKQSLAELAAQNFDRVFIALHGRYGEDGTLQGALELLGIPYTGSGVMASSLAMNKIMTKRVWLEQGLPTPRYKVVRNLADTDAACAELGLPLILKAPHEGSTLGLYKVSEPDELHEAFRQVINFDHELLAEQFVVGRELTIPVVGKGEDARALPVIEIFAPDGNYDFEHKYISNDTRYECPANLAPELASRIQGIAVQAYRALGCEGWARVDIMLDAQNQSWLLEINTSPGMTTHSLVPMGAKAEGMSYADLCVFILSQASCKIHRPVSENG